MHKSTALKGAQLKRRRRALGLTCAELGERAGIDGSTIAHVERGRRKLAGATAGALLAALEDAENDQKTGAGLVPEAIRPRRLRLGLTQQELADRSGVSHRTIWLHEQGQTTHSPTRVNRAKRATLEAIGRALAAAEAEPTVDVGDEIRQKREAAGLGQRDLAKLTGLSANCLLCIETKKCKPWASTLRKIRAALEACPALTPLTEIRRRRHALRLTLEELSCKAHISPKTLRNIENGEPCRKPSVLARHLARLHQALESAAARGGEEGALPSGSTIRERRTATGLTMAALARRAGISRRTLWNVEEGRIRPRLRTLRAIERILAEAEAGTLSDHGDKNRRLYPKNCQAAKERLKKISAPPPPRELKTEKGLNQTHHDFLDALLDLQAFHPAMRVTVAEVASRTGRNNGTLGRAAAYLKGQGLIDSKEGRDGGCWLTPSGRSAAERFRR